MTGAPDTPRLTPAWRLVATLGGFGALSGLLIVLVHSATQPAIRAHREATLDAAINEVLGDPDRYETLYVAGDALSAARPDGVAAGDAETVYLGYRGGRPIGYAIHAAGQGFQDTISLLFGYDPRTDRLLGMTVLESKETPGLGDKIYKDAAFVAAFAGAATPLSGVKVGGGRGLDGEVVMITGATISSRAVIRAINTALERMRPLIAPAGGERAP